MFFHHSRRVAAPLIAIWWLLGALATPWAAADVEAAGRSSISVPSTTFDFGEVMEGAEVEHDFIVKNTGNATLEIRKVSRD